MILYLLKFNFTENGPKTHLCITHSYLHNISSGFCAIFKNLAFGAILSIGGSVPKIKIFDFFQFVIKKLFSKILTWNFMGGKICWLYNCCLKSITFSRFFLFLSNYFNFQKSIVPDLTHCITSIFKQRMNDISTQECPYNTLWILFLVWLYLQNWNIGEFLKIEQ